MYFRSRQDERMLISSLLKSCVSGELASSIETASATALAEFLASSSCPLDAEMRGSVMMWLSFGVTGAEGAAAGVGMGVGFGFSIPTQMAGQFSSAISSGLNLSSTCKSAMGLLLQVRPPGLYRLLAALKCVVIWSPARPRVCMSSEVLTALFGWIIGSNCSSESSSTSFKSS
jgi:hypothetical protein